MKRIAWWKWLIIAVLVLGMAGTAVRGLRGKSEGAAKVQVASVKRGDIVRTVTGAGKVEAATTVKISSTLSGDLISRPVNVGDRIKVGQVIARVDRQRYEASVKQFQAALSAARSDLVPLRIESERLTLELGRVVELNKKGLASNAEVDKAKSDVASARAREVGQADRASQASAALEEAKTNLSKTTLLSPIDGDVIEVSREVGERVRGSDFSEDVVMTLAALHTMEVKIEVGEHDVVFLKVDQKADIKLDAFDGQNFPGKVTEIAHKALIRNPGTEQETTSFPVTVTLEQKPDGVYPGMSAEVRIRAENRDGALIVPVQSVTVRPEKTLKPDSALPVEGVKQVAPKDGLAKVVFVVESTNRIRAQRVKTGISSDTDIEIVNGLKEGDKIVEGPYRALAKELKDGDLVEEPKQPGGGKTADKG